MPEPQTKLPALSSVASFVLRLRGDLQLAPILTGRQIREGRALVRWSAEQLARHAELGAATVVRAELYDAEAPITIAQVRAIREALERRGVTFATGLRDTPSAELKDGPSFENRRPKGTVTIGFTNRRNQTVVCKTGRPGNNYRQIVYVLRCNECGHVYGSNGSEIFKRRCPGHDGGKTGPEIEGYGASEGGPRETPIAKRISYTNGLKF